MWWAFLLCLTFLHDVCEAVHSSNLQADTLHELIISQRQRSKAVEDDKQSKGAGHVRGMPSPAPGPGPLLPPTPPNPATDPAALRINGVLVVF